VPLLNENANLSSGTHTHVRAWRNGANFIPSQDYDINFCSESNDIYKSVQFPINDKDFFPISFLDQCALRNPIKQYCAQEILREMDSPRYS